MLGGMQDFALRVPRLIDHAAREHGAREIVTRWADGHETRTSWAGIHRDARRLAQAVVQARLAACVQVQSITSHYHWQGALQEAAEWRLACKTLPHATSA